MGAAALNLDDLPKPPAMAMPVPRRPGAAAIAAFMWDANQQAKAYEPKLLEMQEYLRSLREALDRFCENAENAPPNPEMLTAVIDQLLAWERERAAEMEEPIGEARRIQRQAHENGGRRHNWQAPWGRLATAMEDAMVSELEARRDARLRLEVLRAKLINAGKGPSPVFDSADEALKYLDEQLRNAGSAR